MKKLLPIIISLFLFSCSSPFGDIGKENMNYDSAHTSQISQAQIINYDTVAQPSDDLKKFLSKAKKINFFPADTANKFRASDHKNYFGMVNVSNTFADYERSAMIRAKNACLDLIKKNPVVHIKVEEWVFENEADAKQVDEALSAPLEDKRSERFARYPLTFWRFHERMYYVHTEKEQDRADMDKVSDLLVKVLSPEQ